MARVSPVVIGSGRLLVEFHDVTRRQKINRENALLVQHGAGRHLVTLVHIHRFNLGGHRGTELGRGQRLQATVQGGMRRQGAVAIASTRTEPSRVSMRRDSADWPSTAPPTPSLTATDSTLRSPVSMSWVTMTPDFSLGTERSSRTAG